MDVCNIWLLVLLALFPVFSCRHLRKDHQQATGSKIQRHTRAGKSTKQFFAPFLKIRNKPPEVLEVPAGENAVLECEAGGNPPATIHWLKNGNRLSQNTFEATNDISGDIEQPVPPLGLSFTRSRLYIDCVGPVQEGSYTCVAENAFTKVSVSTELRVVDLAEGEEEAVCLNKKSFGSPPRIHMWTHNRMEIIGTDVQLFCRSHGIPQPHIIWLGPDELPIQSGQGKYEILPNGDLIIHHIVWPDMGDYICTVKNSHGTDSTSTFLYPTAP